MVAYSSTTHSPSLRKPAAFSASPGAMARFRASNVLGDPFALATLSIALVCCLQTLLSVRRPLLTSLCVSAQLAWLIAFIAGVIANVQAENIQSKFPNLAWWTLVYVLGSIAGIAFVMGSDTSHIYSTAVCLPSFSSLSWFSCLRADTLDRSSAISALAWFIPRWQSTISCLGHWPPCRPAPLASFSCRC